MCHTGAVTTMVIITWARCHVFASQVTTFLEVCSEMRSFLGLPTSVKMKSCIESFLNLILSIVLHPVIDLVTTWTMCVCKNYDDPYPVLVKM